MPVWPIAILAIEECLPGARKNSLKTFDEFRQVARVVPVTIPNANWQRVPFATFQALLNEALAVTKRKDQDSA